MGKAGKWTFDFRLSTFDFRLSTFDFRLSTFDFRLSTFDFRLSTFDFSLGGGLGGQRATPRNEKSGAVWAPLLRKDVGIFCLDELVEQVFQVLLATGADGGLTVAEGVGAEVIKGDLLGLDFGADA